MQEQISIIYKDIKIEVDFNFFARICTKASIQLYDAIKRVESKTFAEMTEQYSYDGVKMDWDMLKEDHKILDDLQTKLKDRKYKKEN